MLVRSSRPSAALLLLAALFGTSQARAQATAADKAAADALFNDARALIAQKSFRDACPKLAESQRLDPVPGTALYLADCYEKNGQTASAWSTFNDAAAMAHAAGQADRERIANQRSAALKAKLSTITITLAPTSDPSVVVTRDGQPVRAAQLGSAIPVDPGPHKVEASQAGRTAWSATILVKPDADQATVTVPLLEPAAVAPSTPTPTAVPPVASSPPALPPPASPPPPATTGGTQRTIGFVAGGAGVVLGVVGVVLHFSAVSKHNDAQDNHCTPTCAAGGGDTLNASAASTATTSTILMAAGGALLAGGVIALVTAPATEPTTAWRFSPFPMRAGAGLSFGGAL